MIDESAYVNMEGTKGEVIIYHKIYKDRTAYLKKIQTVMDSSVSLPRAPKVLWTSTYADSFTP